MASLFLPKINDYPKYILLLQGTYIFFPVEHNFNVRGKHYIMWRFSVFDVGQIARADVKAVATELEKCFTPAIPDCSKVHHVFVSRTAASCSNASCLIHNDAPCLCYARRQIPSHPPCEPMGKDLAVEDSDDPDIPAMPMPLRIVLEGRGFSVPTFEEPVVENATPDTMNTAALMKCNDYVLFQFQPQSANKSRRIPHLVYYVGRIVRPLRSGKDGIPLWQIESLRRKGTHMDRFVRPAVADIGTYPASDIIRILSAPIITKFSLYLFPDDLSVYSHSLR
jgi:hypothetical protein